MKSAAVLLAAAAASVSGQGYGPDQPGTPADFMCDWRKLTAEYAKKLRPDAEAKVFDALQLQKFCNDSVRPDPSKLPIVFPPRNDLPHNAVYVDGATGQDTNSGSIDKPLKTIAHALTMKMNAVVIRAGTYYIKETLKMGAEHNGMTVTNYPGEEVWLSGGRKLENLKWQKSNLKGYNIWEADISSVMTDDKEISELRVDGERAWLARYPNANPESQFWPIGYLTSARGDWLEPKIKPNPNQAKLVNVTGRTWDMYFTDYSGGINGTCAVYDPPFSFFCQNTSTISKGSGCGGCFTYYLPGGLNTKTSLPKSYPSLSKIGTKNKAYLSAWRAAHWANWKFEIESYHADDSTNIIVGKGGFQGSRGGPGSDYYIENVIEELDVVGEYYYDIDKKILYISSNTTEGTPPSASSEIIAVTEKDLLSITSPSKSTPVKDITITGLGFRDTRQTMLEPHAVPSGGDWSLERMGVVFIENSVNIDISKCKFWKLGGNSIMISKSALHTTVQLNEFAWLGSSAVAAWGWTDEISDNGIHGYDGTTGDFPRYTTIIGNLFREIGIWEKQSSAYFQAKSAESVVRGNIVFNLARAGFNMNDGFGGGDQIYENILFNTCRESSDHGPINSWDRQPYMTTIRTGQPDWQMQWRNITRNIVIANYGGVKEVDNDDGSLFYRVHSNFMVYGWGQKFKCGGIESFNNVKAFVTTGGKFDAGCVLKSKVVFAPNLWHNDVLVSGENHGNLAYRQAWGKDKEGHDWDKTQVFNNTIYVYPTFNAMITAVNGSSTVTLPQFQKAGEEPGSVQYQHIPASSEIINWGRNRLGTFLPN